MGSGKTAMGKRLAGKLGLKFVDTDNHITSRTGYTINYLFQTYGEEHFRAMEKQVLDELVASDEAAIISTGGGFPCYNGNLEKMNASGLTLFLDWPLEELLSRLSNTTDRPLLNDHKENLQGYISKVMQARRPIYEGAELVLRSPSFEQLLEVTSDKLQYPIP